MSERIEIGYVCYKGHFVFKGDPEDSCGTKDVATIYVEPNEWADAKEMQEIVDFALASVHQKIDAWRNG
jgi:hypothetical protein